MKNMVSIKETVRDIFGSEVRVENQQSVLGGDINEAYRLLLSNGEEVFLKINKGVGENFFSAEAKGLVALKDAGANVPEVLGIGSEPTGERFLLLRYERSKHPAKDYWALLGHNLANIHRAKTASWTRDGVYGFYEDNFIGATKQKNSPKSGWTEFFRDNRLGAQMKFADHYFDKEDRRLCHKLLEKLDDFLVEPQFPSLLHGDLWSGNVMPDRFGKPMLIDPAVYVGHHEADIAMTELFGGFSPIFYAAYHEIIPKDSGYVERRDIYNLYHLLNHLNLFGGSYLVAVRRILKKYVG